MKEYRIWISIFLLLFTMTSSIRISATAILPSLLQNTQEMAISHDYPCENYTVTTADGYILQLYRIPGKKGQALDEAKQAHKKPVILMHGLFSSSDTWIINGDISFTYMLADSGFDIWLPNFRGNTYSRKHLFLDPDSREYWNFSFDEMIKYDVPAILTKVLEITGHQKLSLVGHSIGGGIVLGSMSVFPEFFSKYVTSFLGLGPTTNIYHSQYRPEAASIIRTIRNLIEKGIYSIKENSECGDYTEMCRHFVKKTSSHDGIINEKAIYAANQIYPAGESMQFLIQALQQSLHETGFYYFDSTRQYEFGNVPKSIHYAIFLGEYDTQCVKEDVEWLLSELKLPEENIEYKIYENYGHSTFILPKDDLSPLYDALEFIKYWGLSDE